VTVSAAQFQQNFPAFSNSDKFPTPVIEFWLGVVYGTMLDPSIYTTDASRDLLAQLFVAHNLSLEMVAIASAAQGAPPGTAVGAISAKGVDGVTVSYDVGSTALENQGFWGLTTYGQRFLYMARLFGARPLQLGVGCVLPLSGAGAWFGPPVDLGIWY